MVCRIFFGVYLAYLNNDCCLIFWFKKELAQFLSPYKLVTLNTLLKSKRGVFVAEMLIPFSKLQ